MEQINAPYNFVPLSETVVTPEWAELVSHDLPFKDGISGELQLTITAQTNILVGGENRERDDATSTPGSVHFFKMENGQGKYAIPGSSLRGMIRSVMEIATFSRMNAVDDRSFGLRDISRANSVYSTKVSGNVKTGFMQQAADGGLIITPCKMARLDHRDLEKWLGVGSKRNPIFKKDGPKKGGHKRVSDKYNRWQSLSSSYIDAEGCIACEIKEVDHDNYQENIATQLGVGSIRALPVFTGQISDCRGDKEKTATRPKVVNKHKDFVFYDKAPAASFDVNVYDSHAWRDFLFIHNDASDTVDTDESWPNYWRGEFRAGREVPVFYIQSEVPDGDSTKQRLQIGLAYLPKLAGDFSVYDLIRHTSENHFAEDKLDFTTLLFGKVGKEPNQSLKGRVYFEPADLVGDQEPEPNPKPTILNGAKPSYFPNYLEQSTDDSKIKLKAGTDYATYLSTQQNPTPRIRGWKRYPAQKSYKAQALEGDQLDNHRVQTVLHTLPAGSEFKGRLSFHNLKPCELGALLWCLGLEGKDHSLGMGKSFGGGRVKVSYDWQPKSGIACNDFTLSVREDSEYISAFKKYMTKALKVKSWLDSDQIKSLIVLSDYELANRRIKSHFKHMPLADYAHAKKRANNFVLCSPKLVGSVLSTKIKEETTTWPEAKIYFQPGANILTATVNDTATTELNDEGKAYAKSFYDSLSKNAKGKAKKGKLIKSVLVKQYANNFVLVKVTEE